MGNMSSFPARNVRNEAMKKMKNIYLVERSRFEYDEYGSFVVICHDSDMARNTHPRGDLFYSDGVWCREDGTIYEYPVDDWEHPDKVIVTLLGTAIEEEESGVVLASFNAA